MMKSKIFSGHYANTNPMDVPKWLTFLDSPVYRTWNGNCSSGIFIKYRN